MKLYRKKLENGISILGIRREGSAAAAGYGFKFGRVNDLQGCAGSAHFLEHMMFKSHPHRSSNEISRYVENHGGEINAFTNYISTFYNCNSLPSETHHVLSILLDLLRTPNLKKGFLEEKNVVLEEMSMEDESPSETAYYLTKSALYDNAYGTSILGTKRAIKKMKPKDLENCFSSGYTSNNMVVAFVGDVDPEKILRSIQDVNLPKGKTMDVIPKKRNISFELRREGLIQAQVCIGVHGPLPRDHLHSAFSLMTDYLTTGFSSILFDDIREERGLTYGVPGILDYGYNHTDYIIQVGTDPKNVELVKKLIVLGFDKAQRITKRELDLLKQRVLNRAQVKKESSESLLTELFSSEVNNLNFDLQEDKIKHVTLDEFRKVAKLKSHSSVSLLPI